MLTRKRRIPAEGAALAVLCLFLALAGWPFLRRMGIEVDEALVGVGLYGRLRPVYAWNIFDVDVPVMVLSYLGALKAWICAPLFLIGGPGAVTVRLPGMLMGIATVVVFWRLLREMAGRRAAWAGAVLLATDTSFLLLTTVDFGPVALSLLLKTSLLFLFVRWRRTGRTALFAAAWFLAGLAMWDKAVFAWVAAGLFAGAVAAFPREVLATAARPKLLAAALGAFALGAFPLLAYNLARPMETVRRNASVSAKGLAGKARLLQATVEGRVLFGFYTSVDTPPQPGKAGPFLGMLSALSDAAGRPIRNWTVWAALGAVLALPLVWRTSARRAATFGVVAFAVGWLAMALTAGAGAAAHHIVLLWPLHLLAIAVVAAELSRRGRRATAAAAAAVAVLVAANLLVTSQYYQDLVLKGPAIRWTDAQRPLQGLLEQTRAQSIFVVDWGILESLELLSEGSLPLFFADPNAGSAMAGPGTFFVSHVAEFEQVPGANAAVLRAAEASGYRKETLAVVRDRHGRAVFEIFQFRP